MRRILTRRSTRRRTRSRAGWHQRSECLACVRRGMCARACVVYARAGIHAHMRVRHSGWLLMS